MPLDNDFSFAEVSRKLAVSSRTLNGPSFSMPRHTILFFDHTAQWSGGEISLFNLVTHLNQTKYRPVVVLFADGALREKLDEAGIATRVVALDESVSQTRKDEMGARSLLKLKQIGAIWRFIRRLRRVIRGEGAQVVHCNSLKSDLIGGIAARLAGVPVIWHVRDRIADDYLPSPIVKAFRLAARLIPTRVIAVSGATLLTLPNVRGVAIHNGTVFQNFDDLQSRLPFAGGAPTFGIVGRLTRWKGQHVFLRAAAIVRVQVPDAKFQIVGAALFGEENYERELRALATELGLSEAVEWLGFRRDVPQVVARMDALVHASTTGEPFGQVLIEGMAASRPVIATEGGGVPEIVLDGETGLLVAMGEVEPLADAMLRLWRDPERARMMGGLGRLRVQSEFTIEATARRVERVWEELIAP